MEVFRRVLERTLSVERNKVASRTRRACSKQITDLEGVVTNLRAQLKIKDSNIFSLKTHVGQLDNEINVKKDEMQVLEGEIVAIRKVLEDKDKHNNLLQRNLAAMSEKIRHQSKTLASTQKELAVAKHEGEDVSGQLWKLVEENCNVNKRILQLDMEVHSLEEMLTRAKYDLEKAEQKSDATEQKMEVFKSNYEKKTREVIELGTRERNLQAMVINLSGELEQWKRNSKWEENYFSDGSAHNQLPVENAFSARPSSHYDIPNLNNRSNNYAPTNKPIHNNYQYNRSGGSDIVRKTNPNPNSNTSPSNILLNYYGINLPQEMPAPLDPPGECLSNDPTQPAERSSSPTTNPLQVVQGNKSTDERHPKQNSV